MKLLVISDSHGSRAQIEKALELAEGFDALFHLGDGLRDLPACVYEAGKPVFLVKGNGDFTFGEPEEIVTILGGARVFATHGHRYGVKMGLERLDSAAVRHRAELVLYGHTHIPKYELRNGVFTLCPGSCSHYAPCCAIVTVGNGPVTAAMVKL